MHVCPGSRNRLNRTRIALGAAVIGAQFLLLFPATAAAQPDGHDHVLSVPVSIGPLILRVALLAAVPVVAAFAMLRGFLPEPDRTTRALVAGAAAIAGLLELMLAESLDIPPSAVPLVLAGLAIPIFLVLTRDPRFASAAGRARRLAPWVVVLAAGLALVELTRAWLGAGDSAAAVLHTGVLVALVGLSWFTVCRPARMFVLIVAGLLAGAALAASTYATVSQRNPGTAVSTTDRIGDGAP